MTCANCGGRILWRRIPDGSYWEHPEGNSTWCYMGKAEYVELPLAVRDSQAEPA